MMLNPGCSGPGIPLQMGISLPHQVTIPQMPSMIGKMLPSGWPNMPQHQFQHNQGPQIIYVTVPIQGHLSSQHEPPCALTPSGQTGAQKVPSPDLDAKKRHRKKSKKRRGSNSSPRRSKKSRSCSNRLSRRRSRRQRSSRPQGLGTTCSSRFSPIQQNKLPSLE